MSDGARATGGRSVRGEVVDRAPSARRSSSLALGFAVVSTRPGWPEFVKRQFFDRQLVRARRSRRSLDAFLLNVKIFCIAEALILRARAAARGRPRAARPVFFPLRAARDRLRRLLPRRADDPRDHRARLRRPGAGAVRACRPRRRSGGSSRSCSSTPPTSRRSTAPGSSRCTRARRRRRARSG